MRARTITVVAIIAVLIPSVWGVRLSGGRGRQRDLLTKFVFGQADTLRGMKGVHVVVHEPPSHLISGDVTEESLRIAVEQHLRQCGIGVLSEDEVGAVPGKPFLYVGVSAVVAHGMEYNVALSADVELNQTVSLTRDPNQTCYATTWRMASRSNVLGRPKAARVRRTVHYLVAKFTEEYLRVNPGVGETIRQQQAGRREQLKSRLDINDLVPDIDDVLSAVKQGPEGD